ncbi:MAG TPA: M23 family metallopeptidase [Candidatus Dormibacteraeota bacterium]
MKLRVLAPSFALAAAVLTIFPAQAYVRYYIPPPPPPPDYRAPIASALALDEQYAQQTRDQLAPVIAANTAEGTRVLAAISDAGSERNQAGALATARAEQSTLAALGSRLQLRQANLDSLAGTAQQQLNVLYDIPVEDGQAAFAALDNALTNEAGDALQAAYDEARQALVDRGLVDTPRLSWPEAAGFEISQGYGPTDFEGEPPYAGYDHFHMGVDLAAPEGTPVLAPADGVVVLTGAEGSLGRYFGYGNHIVIAHGGQLETIYGHLDQVNVQAGDWVGRGQVIGLEGSTGYSTGPHLHFEVHAGGQLADPATYLG